MNTGSMRLRVLLPTEILFDGAATKVTAEAENGSFCLLPRHADFVAALVPGILSFFTAKSDDAENSEGLEKFVAIDSGLLIKCGDQVSVSTFNAVSADNLDLLKSTVADHFYDLSEREIAAKTALARLEAGTLRRFMEMDIWRIG